MEIIAKTKYKNHLRYRMNYKLFAISILGILFISIGFVYAIPEPCSEEKLLNTSDFAIEGYVVEVKCGEPYNSGKCIPWPGESTEFKPQLVSDCIATVEVTKNLKGEYDIGEKVNISFIKEVQDCENGIANIPGIPMNDFRLYSKIRYYHSTSCRFSNSEVLEFPSQIPEPEVEEHSRLSFLMPFKRFFQRIFSFL
ncbi:MAG: hypothetical protein PWR30_198 [Candidatus Woesearchaeota archaeon]|nr:hypothetical protein [Candidatus Woesearchaeota archaeon]